MRSPRCFQTVADFCRGRTWNDATCVHVCKSRESDNLRVTERTRVPHYINHYSVLPLKVSWTEGRGKSYKDLTKGAAQRLILLSGLRPPPHPTFSFIYAVCWGRTGPSKTSAHLLQYYAFYCWVSKEHPGGSGYCMKVHSAKTVWCKHTHVYVSPPTHKHTRPTTSPISFKIWSSQDFKKSRALQIYL